MFSGKSPTPAARVKKKAEAPLVDAPAFIFLPVIVQKVVIGALYADRKTIGQPISEIEHRHLSMLRNQLVLAIRYRQGTR